MPRRGRLRLKLRRLVHLLVKDRGPRHELLDVRQIQAIVRLRSRLIFVSIPFTLLLHHDLMLSRTQLPLELSQGHNFPLSFKAHSQTLILPHLLLRLSLQLLMLLKPVYLTLPDLFGQQIVLFHPLNERYVVKPLLILRRSCSIMGLDKPRSWQWD